jgi:hypothetical protein
MGLTMSEPEYHPDDDEDMRALRRAAAVLDFTSSLPPDPPRISVPIPDVPHTSRSGYGGLRVRVPNKTYLIRCGSFVKIGMAADIADRLRALEAANPHELDVLKVLAGGRQVERSLHVRFAAYRHRGEWFRLEGELAAWIEAGCTL